MRIILFYFFLHLTVNVSGQTKSTFPVASPESQGVSSSRLSKIDRLLTDYIKAGKIPGATALIIKNGKIVYYKAFGYGDISTSTLLKRNDIFRIASQTKPITSLAVMMLFEEGKFSLDDPISKFIPQFKNPKVLLTFNETDSTYTTEPARTEITIRHLLTHSSGIDYAAIGNSPFPGIYAKAGVPSGIGNHKGLLAEKMNTLAKLPLRNHPGEKWNYGLNTDLLGYLVEIWSGTTLNDFFSQRIFQPLGMTDTYFYLPEGKHDRLVSLHHEVNGLIKKMSEKAYDDVDPNFPRLNGTYYSGGAGLSSTVEDYAKFLQMLVNKGEYNGVRLVSRKTVELMLTDQLPAIQTSEFGFGLELETDVNDHQSIRSMGSFRWAGAFNTHFWADPKENLIGVLYTNVYRSSWWEIGELFTNLTYQSIND